MSITFAHRVKDDPGGALEANGEQTAAPLLRLMVSEPTISSLAKIARNVVARVVGVSGSDSIAIRLMEMGIVPGAPICVLRTAPFGDPIQVRVRGYHLALRNVEAETITVTLDD
jgi:ferrous iron transport protein A